MNHKEKKGMWISLSRVGTEENYWIISVITALIAATALLLAAAELTGLADIYTPWAMVAAAACVAVASGVMTKLNKEKLFYPVILAVMLLLVIFCGRMILNGGCIFWNQMGDAWTAGSGWVIPEVGQPAANAAVSLFMFSVFAGILTAAVCCGLTAIGGYVLAIAVPVLSFVAMIMFNEEGTFVQAVLCMAAGICLLAAGSRKDGSVKRAVISLASVAALSLILILVSGTAGMEQWTAEKADDFRDRLHTVRYETEYTTLPEGDFKKYKADGGQSQPALVVTMEQPEEMYLRGFTGADFSDDTWSALDTAVLAENEDLLYWMNQNGWNPQMQFSEAVLAADKSGKLEENAQKSVTVQNINACSEYLYVPCSLSSGDCLEEEFISPDGVPADGNRTYMFSVITKGTDKIAGTIKGLKNSKDTKIEDYRQAEGAYRAFVYSNYLSVPEEINEMMMPYWDKVHKLGGKNSNLSSAQAQSYARTFLEAAFPEKGEAPQITLPLEVAKGTSYQQATAAVMTLRHFGIPARYAEGYVITEEMAKEMKRNSSIEVDSSCAGAWAEVYHDGIGWIPVNLTPGIEDMNSGIDPDAEDGDIPQEIPPKGDLLQDESEDTIEEPEPKGGYVVSVKKMISFTFLLIAVLLILTIVVIVIRRRLLLKRRGERWNGDNVNDAVAGIFADTERLLRMLGFDRGKGSMRELLSPVRERLGEAFADSMAAMTAINDRAMFSSRQLDEEQREAVKVFYAETVQHLKAGAKWHRRMWMQWILCLY